MKVTMQTTVPVKYHASRVHETSIQVLIYHREIGLQCGINCAMFTCILYPNNLKTAELASILRLFKHTKVQGFKTTDSGFYPLKNNKHKAPQKKINSNASIKTYYYY